MDGPGGGVHRLPVTFDLPDVAATRALGARLAARLFDGAVVLLDGPLGAGKTAFAQGVAAGLGVDGPVPSPTYVLVAEYPDARLPLRHADLYRLDALADALALGLEERVGEEGVWLVEWASRFPELWPADRLEVRLDVHDGGRRARLRATGPRHAALLAALGEAG